MGKAPSFYWELSLLKTDMIIGMKEFLQIFGPLLGFVAMIPYIIDVIRKKTKPNIVSWLTWTILTGVGSVAVFVQAGFIASLLPLCATISTLSVVLLGIKYGFAKYTKFDAYCQASTLVGLALWGIFNSPLVGLIAAIVIDAVAVMPTLRHAYLRPEEETWQTFAIAFFSSGLTLLSVSNYTASRLSYPLYLTSANGVITATIIFMRLKKGLKLSR